MAVKIRLKRMGKKKQPFYRIVVADSRAPRDGRSIEKIGHYNPIPEQTDLVINEDRLFYWLDEGAIPSDTVFSLLRGRGLTLKYELKKRDADEATIAKEMHKWELAHSERGKKKAATELAKQAAEEAVIKAEEEAAEKLAKEEAAEKAAAEKAEKAEKDAAAAAAAAEAVVEEEVPAVEEAVAEPAEKTETEDS